MSGGEEAGGGVSGATAKPREERREEERLEEEGEETSGFVGLCGRRRLRGREGLRTLLLPVARRAETEGWRIGKMGEAEGGFTVIWGGGGWRCRCCCRSWVVRGGGKPAEGAVGTGVVGDGALGRARPGSLVVNGGVVGENCNVVGETCGVVGEIRLL